MNKPEPEEDSFTRQAARPRPSAAAEFLHFLLSNKKWWLAPIVIALGIIALLVVLGGSGMAPFIYSLF
jgi:hypothetical protein